MMITHPAPIRYPLSIHNPPPHLYIHLQWVLQGDLKGIVTFFLSTE